jgi:hypothetical protein
MMRLTGGCAGDEAVNNGAVFVFAAPPLIGITGGFASGFEQLIFADLKLFETLAVWCAQAFVVVPDKRAQANAIEL